LPTKNVTALLRGGALPDRAGERGGGRGEREGRAKETSLDPTEFFPFEGRRGMREREGARGERGGGRFLSRVSPEYA